jgi:hypothetical protein
VNESIRTQFDLWQRRALIFGVVLVAAAIILGIRDPKQFFDSYLLAFVFWLGLSLGCAAFLMMNYLTGGNWGFPVRRPLEAGVRVLPWASLLLLPLLFGMPYVFAWTHKEIVAKDPVLQLKSIYLNVPFFLAREAIYFAVWLWLAYRLSHSSSEFDRTGDPQFPDRLEHISGWALVVYALTVTFFAIDWVMSLDAHWFSTIFGLIFIVIQVQGAIALSILVARLLAKHDPISKTITPDRFNDLGNLLLTFVMLWAYLAFSQFLIIWSGDLINEITWYIPRAGGGWAVVAAVLIVCYFAVPFFLLLLRTVKRRVIILSRVCIALLILSFVDVFWMIAPSFHPAGPRLNALDLLLPLGVGGLWTAFYIWQLKRYPLLPPQDPRLIGALGHGA